MQTAPKKSKAKSVTIEDVLFQIEDADIKILDPRTASALRVAMDDLARDIAERFNVHTEIVCCTCNGNQAHYKIILKVKNALPPAVIHRVVGVA
jgi:hypothetical protein